MPLIDTAVRNAKPGVKPAKLFDGRGLFLIVTPTGGKWWRFRYSFDGKEKLLALGTYPDVSLASARKRRDEAPSLADTMKEKIIRRLEVDAFPVIGNRPIASLAAADLIRVIERIEQRGSVDIARRVHNYIGRVFRCADWVTPRMK